jgi:raffinose/stachyose/melibiose transport system permease protein
VTTTYAPTTTKGKVWRWVGGILSIIVVFVLFIVPFIFILLTASKNKADASDLEFSWPTEFTFFSNLSFVIQDRDYQLLRAFGNSLIITVVSVFFLVLLSAMVGYVLQRRKSRWNKLVTFLVLFGLIMPPAVVPTIWVLQRLALFNTIPGLILVHIALGLPFCVLLFTAFLTTVPRDLDEAAIVDGAGPTKLFFRVILPLLKPVTVTVTVVQVISVFNDFNLALYFLPGTPTVQLTLYNYSAQSSSSFNLLFMVVLLVTIPPLIMYLVLNRQIVAGMTSGAVKG